MPVKNKWFALCKNNRNWKRVSNNRGACAWSIFVWCRNVKRAGRLSTSLPLCRALGLSFHPISPTLSFKHVVRWYHLSQSFHPFECVFPFWYHIIGLASTRHEEHVLQLLQLPVIKLPQGRPSNSSGRMDARTAGSGIRNIRRNILQSIIAVMQNFPPPLAE